MRKFIRLAAVLGASALASVAVRAAPDCSPAGLAAAVDRAGASLRTFNSEAQPKLTDRVERLRIKKGWSKEEAEDKTLDYLQDERLAAFDTKSSDLLERIDSLGRAADNAKPDCEALAGVESASKDLLSVMEAKSSYTLAKIDKELGGEEVAAAAPTKEQPPKEQAANDQAAKPQPVKEPPAKEQPAQGPPKAESAAVAKPEPKLPPPSSLPWQAAEETGPGTGPPGIPYGPVPPQSPASAEDGYSIEEIRDATSGFFGTISTNLATVIERAFSISGRPTGYVLGNEGGGAFLAGVRYGEGTLYLRQGGKSKVYWHGPSIGTDLGASGSRTLFLIYKLDNPEDLYRNFTGIDGSAYFVGGIGLTLMKGGRIVLAPIRSGLGLRLGANIGYVRFTPRQTWNPF